MASNSAEAFGVVLKAYDDFSRTFDKYNRDVAKLGANSQTAATKVGGAWAKASAGLKQFAIQSLSMAAGQAVYAVLASGIHKISAAIGDGLRRHREFQQAMANVGAVANATVSEMDQLRRAAIAQAETSVFTAKQAADAQYYLASAGMNATQIMEAQRGVMDLAAATQSDLAMTSETVAAALSQFGLAADQSGRVADVFTNAISGSQATMDKLQTSMRYAGPVMGALGYQIEETTGGLMALFNAGYDASQAGTILRGAMSRLLNPTKQMREVMKKYGLSVYDSTGKVKPFIQVIEELETAGLGPNEMLKVFGQRAGPGMIALMEAGADSVRKYTEQVKVAGAAADKAGRQMDTIEGAMKKLESAWEAFAITFVSKFEKEIQWALEAFAKGIQWIRALMMDNEFIEKALNAKQINAEMLKIQARVDLITKAQKEQNVAGMGWLDQVKLRLQNLKLTVGGQTEINALLARRKKAQEALNLLGKNELDTAKKVSKELAARELAPLKGMTREESDYARDASRLYGNALDDPEDEASIEARKKARLQLSRELELIGKSDYEQEILRLTWERDKYINSTEDKAAANRLFSAKSKALLDKTVEEAMEAAQKVVDEDDKKNAALVDADIKKNLAIREADKDLHDKIRVMGLSGKALALANLEIELEKYREKTDNEVLIEEYKQKRLAEIDKEFLKKKDTVFQTLLKGWADTNKVFIESFKGAMDSIRSSFQGTVKGLISGEINNLDDAWQALCDNMVEMFASMLAQLLTAIAVSGVAEAIAAIFNIDLGGDSGSIWGDLFGKSGKGGSGVASALATTAATTAAKLGAEALGIDLSATGLIDAVTSLFAEEAAAAGLEAATASATEMAAAFGAPAAGEFAAAGATSAAGAAESAFAAYGGTMAGGEFAGAATTAAGAAGSEAAVSGAASMAGLAATFTPMGIALGLGSIGALLSSMGFLMDGPMTKEEAKDNWTGGSEKDGGQAKFLETMAAQLKSAEGAMTSVGEGFGFFSESAQEAYTAFEKLGTVAGYTREQMNAAYAALSPMAQKLLDSGKAAKQTEGQIRSMALAIAKGRETMDWTKETIDGFQAKIDALAASYGLSGEAAKHFSDEIWNASQDMYTGTGVALGYGSAISDLAAEVVGSMQSMANGADGINAITNGIGTLADAMTDLATASDRAAANTNTIGLGGGSSKAKAGLMHTGGAVERFHTGGGLAARRFHKGGGLAYDEVPIIGQVGEWMIKRQAVDYYGADTLKAINSMKLPKSIAAGQVGDTDRDQIAGAKAPRFHTGGSLGSTPQPVGSIETLAQRFHDGGYLIGHTGTADGMAARQSAALVDPGVTRSTMPGQEKTTVNLHLTVVTPDGKVLKREILEDIQNRQDHGEVRIAA